MWRGGAVVQEHFAASGVGQADCGERPVVVRVLEVFLQEVRREPTFRSKSSIVCSSISSPGAATSQSEADELARHGYPAAGEVAGSERLPGYPAVCYSRDRLRVVAPALVNKEVPPRRPVPVPLQEGVPPYRVVLRDRGKDHFTTKIRESHGDSLWGDFSATQPLSTGPWSATASAYSAVG